MGRVPIAFVHHANQHLISDGYDNREGLSDVVDRYATILDLHERYAVPAALHLSGTLVEALAWSHPELLKRVRELVRDGLFRLIGGTYGENVMPLFSADVNRRQLVELFGLYERHLGCPPEDLRTCWIPERVWDTDRLASVIADPTLPNGGYERVLVDDRILVPSEERSAFDSAGPYAVDPASPAGRIEPRILRPCRIASGYGLVAVPISADLRYWIPPRHPSDLERLSRLAETLDPDDLLVYADDLEKTAGIGGYWDTAHLDRFGEFLAWLSETAIGPVHLDRWLDDHEPKAERAAGPGTFYELAVGWDAGEDYRGWADDPRWAPYAGYLSRTEEVVRGTEVDGDEERLVDLAWKHLLASQHETAWQDPEPDGRSPAPWAKALASHARASIVIARAARWFAQQDRSPFVDTMDVDEDGELEVVLANERLYAVVTPRWGARLVYLFHLGPEGGRLVVGNPTDHWNWQEELNRYMEAPPNHPGAFCDVGAENATWRLRTASGDGTVVFGRTTHGGTIVKTFALAGPRLSVSYEVDPSVPSFDVDVGTVSDYLVALRTGRPSDRGHGRGGPGAPLVHNDGPASSTGKTAAVRTVPHGEVSTFPCHAPGMTFEIRCDAAAPTVGEGNRGATRAGSARKRGRRIL